MDPQRYRPLDQLNLACTTEAELFPTRFRDTRRQLSEEAAAEQASLLGAVGAETAALRSELAAVDDMLAIAEGTAARPDTRVRWLVDWIHAELLDSTRWKDRRASA
jgi:hypothetical protein